MLSGFDKIVEERIQKARKEGAFNNLSGAGKPLKFDDANVPEELRIAYKILKNANFLPPEIELRKQIQNTEEMLSGMEDVQERYKTIKKLNYLIFKLNSVRDTSVALDMPQRYLEKVSDAMKKNE